MDAEPLLIKALPQLPEYQYHTPPVPSAPPLWVSVVDPPLHKVVVPEIPVGVVEEVFMVTVALTGVPHPQLALYALK